MFATYPRQAISHNLSKDASPSQYAKKNQVTREGTLVFVAEDRV